MRNNMVQIDGSSIKYAIKNKKMTSAGLLRDIGRSDSYIDNCIFRGVMPSNTLDLLSRFLDVNVSDLTKKKDTKLTGYSVNLDVSPDKVCLQILFDGEVISSAYSKIKGDTETDLMQAISYAAHMIYKFSEQKRLECE